ncbi:hypothetical protein CTY88_03950 [Acinetobacter seifertii]|nr:hypothetical protein [Acinetobacter seifertii]
MKKSLLIFCLSIAVVSGCSTTYRQSSFINGGGFNEVELAPNYFKVSFSGNEVTSKEKARDFALLRASDLMLARNCKSFQVLKTSDDSSSGQYFLPQTQTTNANVSVYGNSAYGNATTTTYGGGLVRAHYPKITLEVQCSTETWDLNKGIYDTNFINKSLKEKYKIK